MCAVVSWSPLLASSHPQVPGVKKFHKVDEHVYRGAQPSIDGFRNLAKLGIKTVVDLRYESAQAAQEKQEVEHLGMRFIHLPMHNNGKPADQDISRALAILNDKAAWPVFVHCDGGKDRTGVAIACYRMTRYHWTNQRALGEADRYGMTQKPKEAYILAYKAQGVKHAAATLTGSRLLFGSPPSFPVLRHTTVTRVTTLAGTL